MLQAEQKLFDPKIKAAEETDTYSGRDAQLSFACCKCTLVPLL